MRTDRQTDGRTDMTKLIVVFRNFANALKMLHKYVQCLHSVKNQGCLDVQGVVDIKSISKQKTSFQRKLCLDSQTSEGQEQVFCMK
jgi:hypothetical protein